MRLGAMPFSFGCVDLGMTCQPGKTKKSRNSLPEKKIAFNSKVRGGSVQLYFVQNIIIRLLDCKNHNSLKSICGKF
jgi:hypothetical protein